MPKAAKEPKAKVEKPKKEKEVKPKKERAKKEKKEKDPNAPKRALGAYMYFCKDKRDEIKSGVEGNSMGEIAKALGAAWKELDDDAKKPYFEQAEKDKLRYEKDMAAYKGGAAKPAAKGKAKAAAKEEEEDEAEEEDDDDEEDD